MTLACPIPYQASRFGFPAAPLFQTDTVIPFNELTEVITFILCYVHVATQRGRQGPDAVRVPQAVRGWKNETKQNVKETKRL